MTHKILAAATAALLTLPLAAQAAPIVNGGDIAAMDQGIGGNNNLTAGGTASFTYTALTDLEVLDFVSVSSVGFSGGSDLALITFGYDSADIDDVASTYTTFSANGATTEANSTLAGFTLLAGESFTLFFDYDASGENSTSHQYSFATAELAAVPVPAAGLMLLTALGGAAAMRRKAKS